MAGMHLRRVADMEEFNVWANSWSREEANKEVAERIARMQQLWKETVLIADRWDMRVQVILDLPDDLETGHNQVHVPHWSASARYC